MERGQSDEEDDSPIGSLASRSSGLQVVELPADELMGTEEMIEVLREMNDEGSQATTEKDSEEERSRESEQGNMDRVAAGVSALDMSEEGGHFPASEFTAETKEAEDAEDIIINTQGLSITEREVDMAAEDQVSFKHSENSRIDSVRKKRGSIRRRWIKVSRGIRNQWPFRKGNLDHTRDAVPGGQQQLEIRVHERGATSKMNIRRWGLRKKQENEQTTDKSKEAGRSQLLVGPLPDEVRSLVRCAFQSSIDSHCSAQVCKGPPKPKEDEDDSPHGQGEGIVA